jgi:hypothetical protein
MRRAFACFLFLTVPVLLHAGAAAAETGFQFSTINLRAPDDPDVGGVRLSLLHGKNRSVRGLDWGILSLSETGNLTGVALVCGVAKLTGDLKGGASFSLINMHSGRDTGMNGAFINILNNPSQAFNVAFIGVADGKTLIDLGGVNVSDASNVQLGFVNVTRRIENFQFGFLNIAENGFLPVFPVINFPKPGN